MPRALSIRGTRSVEPFIRPCWVSKKHSSQSTRATPSAVSALGSIMPSGPAAITASISPKKKSVSGGFTRTHKVFASLGRPNIPVTRSLASALRETSTESSRSSTTTSAPSPRAFSILRGSMPGAKRTLLQIFMDLHLLRQRVI